MNRDKIETAVTFVVMVSIILLLAAVCMKVMMDHDFKEAESRFYSDVEFEVETKLIERPYSLPIFPWSAYHKHSTRELSEQEITFLQEKKVAECMVDMTNYDDTLIQDRDSAVSLLYNSACRLITDDDREYYVWNEIAVEDIYIFAMVNMKGELFSFRFVTDLECDESEAINYVADCYENSESLYSTENETNKFVNNRELFIEQICVNLEKNKNLDINIFYKDTNFQKKPAQFIKNKGSILLNYVIETKQMEYVFLYFDSAIKKFSGYHLMLY